MAATLGDAAQKTKSILHVGSDAVYASPVKMKPATLELEDELGDVLEKAMRRAGLTPEVVADRAGVSFAKIRDAVDYRPDLGCDELRRIAAVLALNEVGLCALGSGRYPKPEFSALPFCVWPLRMPHGIGVANAYLVAEGAASRALLFDTGAGIQALVDVWPRCVSTLDAVFLTHVEPEHAGGLCDVVARFDAPSAFVPEGARAPCGRGMRDGESKDFGALKVTAFATPGHSAAHNCYLVEAMSSRGSTGLLISGDLVFAGSVGGAYFSHAQLQTSLTRMLQLVPPRTVLAPGHGPMTTVENELRFNPFTS
jgi:hydroxyacylglutathione hydrolase